LTLQKARIIFAPVDERPLKRGGRKYKDLDPDKIIITDADPSTTSEAPSLIAPVPLPPTVSESPFKEEYRSGKQSLAKILKHTLILLLIILLSVAAHNLLLWLGDPKLFDILPWRWALDGADLIIVIKFVAMIVRELGGTKNERGAK
jgi:hypothetical protein